MSRLGLEGLEARRKRMMASVETAATAATGRAVALAWGISRVCLLLLFVPEGWVVGDLNYFFLELQNWRQDGVGQTLPEYPLPAVGVIALPWLIAGQVGGHLLYIGLVIDLTLAADAVFMLHLFRTAPAGRRAALVVWILGPLLLGATSYARFDLVPGLLAACAVMLVWARPRTAGLLVALGAAVKLWPALLLPALVVASRDRRRTAVAALGAGGALLAGSLLLVGWERTVSPITWQSERGLQLESIAATPLMARWGWSGGDYEISFSDFNAYEVTGPGVGSALAATDLMTAGLLAVLLALWVRAWRAAANLDRAAVVWTSLAAVSGLVVTSKVFSPQYLLWLLPLAAAAVAIVDEAGERRALTRWGAGLLVVTLATHVIFPLNYGPLVIRQDATAEMVALLALRNGLLVGLFGVATFRAWRATGRRLSIGYARADSNSQ